VLIDRPSKVLFVAPSLDGGVGSVLGLQIRWLEQRGIRCGAFGTYGPKEKFSAACSLGTTMGSGRDLVLRLLRNPFDLIHLTTGVLGNERLCRAIALAAGNARIICTSHGSVPITPGKLAVDAYTAVSSSAARAYAWMRPEQIRIIPNAVDPNIFHPSGSESSDGNPPILLWVGRTLDADWRSKDVWGFLHFVANTTSRDLRFVIIDSEDRREDLGIDRWLRGRVDYRFGLTPQEMASMYRRVAASGGAWISTSRNEGMPICLLEAWACGCPVIVPRAGGFEIVDNDVNGFVYDINGNFDSLHLAIESQRDPVRRHAVIQEGLNAIQGRFSVEAMTCNYLSLYQEMLRNDMPGSRSFARWIAPLRSRLLRMAVGIEGLLRRA
jgi:glycosyltransferase involved in cell wall biosynthesis